MTDRSPPSGDCPLTWPQQRRNLLLFAACTAMQYLAAPVLYVGITQASLCDRLEADARTANLPGMLFFAMTAMPAILAWLSPQVRALKRNLSLCYALTAAMLAAVAITLAVDAPRGVKLTMVVMQGGMSGAAMPAAIALLWEVIGRGSAESRRGLALAMGFGLGPILAVAGSFAQAALLGGDLFGLKFPGIDYPWSFVALFAGGVPVMLTAACLAQGFLVPPVDREPRREPISAVAGLLIGTPCMFASVALFNVASAAELNDASGADKEWLRWIGYAFAAPAAAAIVYHFRGLLRQKVLFWATVVTILVYSGNTIPSNMNLYSEEVLGDAPEKFAGIQNMLRFGFKAAAGAALGWLLTRTNARAGMLATSALFLTSLLWAMTVTGPWYLVAFGVFGAGELIGVYSPNYIVSASQRHELRRNTAFATMLMVPAAPASYLYGSIVDFVKSRGISTKGMSPSVLGFRLSFLVCAALVLTGIVVALVLLPKEPRPPDEQSPGA